MSREFVRKGFFSVCLLISFLIIPSGFSVEYLVKFVDNGPNLKTFVFNYAESPEIREVSDRIFVINLSDETAKELKMLFPRVIVEKNQKVYLFENLVANGQSTGWNVERVGALDLHIKGIKGQGIKVAILDTGIDYNHEDLDDNYKGGKDFVNKDSNPMDDHGHGTFVAGIIAAEDNGVGILGIAPEAEIYALKVLDNEGIGTIADVISAVDWAIDNQIDVVSMSFGSMEFSQILKDKMDEAYSKGLYLVASAGNEGFVQGSSTVSYPAAYSSVIAVGATDNNNVVAGFSSRGPELEIVAPGVSVESTLPGNSYTALSGTSASAPHVSGAIALLLSGRADSIRESIRKSAKDLGDKGFDIHYGYGLLNVSSAFFSNSANFGEKISALENRTSALEGKISALENKTSIIEQIVNLIKRAVCTIHDFEFCENPSSGDSGKESCVDECTSNFCKSENEAIICGNFDNDSCLEEKKVFCLESEYCFEGQCLERECEIKEVCEMKSCLLNCRGDENCCKSMEGCHFKKISGVGVCLGTFKFCEEREICN